MDFLKQISTDKKLILVTHSGSFHADDILAAAALDFTLKSLGYSYELIRTRDPAIIQSADIVFDVGGIYDPETLRFDHHQIPGPEPRENGIPYSSFGLVWKHFGPYVCDGHHEIWKYIEDNIVMAIDAGDNGIELYRTIIPNLHPVLFHHILFAYRPTWKEREAQWDDNGAFFDLFEFAKTYLHRLIIVARDNYEASLLVRETYERTEDKRIVILDRDLTWEEEYSKYPEPLLVISPRRTDDEENIWRVQTVRNDINGFENRCPLPEGWRGKTGKDFEDASGIEGALFCHKTGFLATAKTKEAAIAMAQRAII